MEIEKNQIIDFVARLINCIEDDMNDAHEVFNEIKSKIYAVEDGINSNSILTELVVQRNGRTTFIIDNQDVELFIATIKKIFKIRTSKELLLNLDPEFDYSIDDIFAIITPKFNEMNFDIWHVELNDDNCCGFVAKNIYNGDIKEISRALNIESVANREFKKQIVTDEGIMHLSDNSYIEYDYGESAPMLSEKPFKYSLILLIAIAALIISAIISINI